MYTRWVFADNFEVGKKDIGVQEMDRPNFNA